MHMHENKSQVVTVTRDRFYGKIIISDSKHVPSENMQVNVVYKLESKEAVGVI